MRPKHFFLLALLSACGSSPAPDAPDAARADDDPDAGEDSARPEGVALCYSALSSSHAATAGFWEALRADDKDARNAAIDALAAAATDHPDEEEFALLLGLAHLWRLAEPRPEDEEDFAAQLESATGSERELERAYALCPTDHRIPAWLGPIKIRMGRMFGNQEQIDEGFAVLEQGIEHYPSFVLFSKLLVHADAPADSADFQQALDAVIENTGYCAGTTDPACTNHPHAAHNLEGAAVFLGDVYAKAGRADDALAAYQGAMASGDYPTWDWHALLDDRIATLDARVAAFATAATDDDPESMWQASNQCSICHAD